jgi:hypothetical protein
MILKSCDIEVWAVTPILLDFTVLTILGDLYETQSSEVNKDIDVCIILLYTSCTRRNIRRSSRS